MEQEEMMEEEGCINDSKQAEITELENSMDNPEHIVQITGGESSAKDTERVEHNEDDKTHAAAHEIFSTGNRDAKYMRNEIFDSTGQSSKHFAMVKFPQEHFNTISMPRNWNQVKRLKMQRQLLHEKLFSKSFNVAREKASPEKASRIKVDECDENDSDCEAAPLLIIESDSEIPEKDGSCSDTEAPILNFDGSIGSPSLKNHTIFAQSNSSTICNDSVFDGPSDLCELTATNINKSLFGAIKSVNNSSKTSSNKTIIDVDTKSSFDNFSTSNNKEQFCYRITKSPRYRHGKSSKDKPNSEREDVSTYNRPVTEMEEYGCKPLDTTEYTPQTKGLEKDQKEDVHIDNNTRKMLSEPNEYKKEERERSAAEENTLADVQSTVMNDLDNCMQRKITSVSTNNVSMNPKGDADDDELNYTNIALQKIKAEERLAKKPITLSDDESDNSDSSVERLNHTIKKWQSNISECRNKDVKNESAETRSKSKLKQRKQIVHNKTMLYQKMLQKKIFAMKLKILQKTQLQKYFEILKYRSKLDTQKTDCMLSKCTAKDNINISSADKLTIQCSAISEIEGQTTNLLKEQRRNMNVSAPAFTNYGKTDFAKDLFPNSSGNARMNKANNRDLEQMISYKSSDDSCVPKTTVVDVSKHALTEHAKTNSKPMYGTYSPISVTKTIDSSCKTNEGTTDVKVQPSAASNSPFVYTYEKSQPSITTEAKLNTETITSKFPTSEAKYDKENSHTAGAGNIRPRLHFVSSASLSKLPLSSMSLSPVMTTKTGLARPPYVNNLSCPLKSCAISTNSSAPRYCPVPAPTGSLPSQPLHFMHLGPDGRLYALVNNSLKPVVQYINGSYCPVMKPLIGSNVTQRPPVNVTSYPTGFRPTVIRYKPSPHMSNSTVSAPYIVVTAPSASNQTSATAQLATANVSNNTVIALKNGIPIHTFVANSYKAGETKTTSAAHSKLKKTCASTSKASCQHNSSGNMCTAPNPAAAIKASKRDAHIATDSIATTEHDSVNEKTLQELNMQTIDKIKDYNNISRIPKSIDSNVNRVQCLADPILNRNLKKRDHNIKIAPGIPDFVNLGVSNRLKSQKMHAAEEYKRTNPAPKEKQKHVTFEEDYPSLAISNFNKLKQVSDKESNDGKLNSLDMSTKSSTSGNCGHVEPLPFLDFPARIVTTNIDETGDKTVTIVASPKDKKINKTTSENNEIITLVNDDETPVCNDDQEILHVVHVEVTYEKNGETNPEILKNNELNLKNERSSNHSDTPDIVDLDEQTELQDIIDLNNNSKDPQTKIAISGKVENIYMSENPLCGVKNGECVTVAERKDQESVINESQHQSILYDSDESYDSIDFERFERLKTKVNKKSQPEHTKHYSPVIESYYTAEGKKALEQGKLLATQAVPLTEDCVVVEDRESTTELLKSTAEQLKKQILSKRKGKKIVENQAEDGRLSPEPPVNLSSGQSSKCVEKKKFIKTKFIILKGDICDRWLDIKNKTGYCNMSDPKFIHYLLKLEESRQEFSQETATMGGTQQHQKENSDQNKNSISDNGIQKSTLCQHDHFLTVTPLDVEDSLGIEEQDICCEENKEMYQIPCEEELDCESPEIPPSTIVKAADKVPPLKHSKKRPAENIAEQPKCKRRKQEFLSENAKRQMNWAVSVFTEWLKENGENDFQFEYKDAAWMNKKLAKFYIQAKTLDGSPYSCESLQTFRRTLSLYLIGYPGSQSVNISINLDPAFHSSNLVLSAVTQLRRDSSTHTSKLVMPICEEDLEKLYSSNTLSDQNPVSLSWKVWFDVTYHLCKGKLPRGFWGLLSWHSLALQSNANGVYYSFVDSSCVPDGEEPGKMYATPCEPDRCPVRTTSLYLSKLNQNCDALFQYPRKSWLTTKDRWFLPIPIGREKMNTMMVMISTHARLSRMYNNASVMMTAKFKELVRKK